MAEMTPGDFNLENKHQRTLWKWDMANMAPRNEFEKSEKQALEFSAYYIIGPCAIIYYNQTDF
jgi:hypothetical protein